MKSSKSEITKQLILNAAVKLSEREHYLTITRDAVAAAAPCAQGSVTAYYPNMGILRDAVIENALDTFNLRIIVQALERKHPRVKRIPKDQRLAAIDSLR